MIFQRKQRAAAPAAAPIAAQPTGFFQRLRQRVNKGQSWLSQDLRDLFADPEQQQAVFEQLEARLIQSDVGVGLCERLLEEAKAALKRKQQGSFDDVVASLRQQLLALLQPLAQPLEPSNKKPFVILVVGVNGSGKTTTIGKIAAQFVNADRKVLLAAGDTFRAAAIEQLQVWGRAIKRR